MCVFCALLEDVTVTWLYGYRRVEFRGRERERGSWNQGVGGFKNIDRGKGYGWELVHTTNTRWRFLRLSKLHNQTYRMWGESIKFSAMRSQAIHQSLVSHFQLFGVKRSQHFGWYGVRLPLSLRSSLPSMQGALGSSHLKTCRTYRPSLGDFHFCMPYHSVVKQA